MTGVQLILKASAPRTLWLGVASVIAGTAAAEAHGNLEILPAIICLIFALSAQATSNILHRYYDEKHGYGENRSDKLVCDDIDSPVDSILKEGVKVFGIVTATAGLAIFSMAGWWTFLFAIAIVLISFINNAGKHPFCRTPFYPLSTFLLFGPVGVIGTELVQSQRSAGNIISWWDLSPAVLGCVVIGLMAMNSHVIYGAFHRRTNIESRRTTFYGRYGRRGAIALLLISTAVYTAIGFAAPYILELYPAWCYFPVPMIGLVFGLYSISLLRPGCWYKAWRVSVINVLFVALASLIAFFFIGYSYTTHNILTPF